MPSPSVEENIDAVVKLEEEALNQRGPSDRVSDAIAKFVGSVRFVIIHILWFSAWITLNVSFWKFDPYPFSLLCMLVALEGVLLSTFVLIKQNRMSQRSDQRNHLDLQINLLAEKEITKVLQLQRLICRRLEIAEAEADPDIEELSTNTAVDHLARVLDEKMLDPAVNSSS